MKDTPKKYLVYARISPRGGDHDRENSIPMQIEYCKRYIRQRGGEVFDVRQDVFKSGKNMDGRPEFRDGGTPQRPRGMGYSDCL